MNKKILFGRSIKDILVAFAPSLVLLAVALFVARKYVNPEPPNHIVISTGDGEGDYQAYADAYRDIIKREGIKLDIRPSSGARENLTRLIDPKSDVDVAFVQDGLEPKEEKDQAIDLVSLGSLYYEPMWIFYHGKKELTRVSQLKGKRVAIGEHGGGTPNLAWKLLEEAGIDKNGIVVVRDDFRHAADALKKGEVDAAFFLATPEEELIKELLSEKDVHPMNMDQAEAITRKLPFLHHLVIPHGAVNLAHNLPEQDLHLVSTTATLVARDTLHPALVDLLLKAATEVHGEPGILERKNEFPIDKDYNFPMSDEAKRFYKVGAPFWQRYLPFWLANLVDRFILIILPLLAVIIPMLKTIPKIMDWRVRKRIHRAYGELKFLETQMRNETTHERNAVHLRELDRIEDRVRSLKVPIEFSEHIYGLRGNIEFVRGKLSSGLERQEKAG